MNPTSDRLIAALSDRYRIERELGQGGMATVYLAQDLKHDRKVALKVLKPELAAVIGAERFVVEIKTTAALQHPHILPLFDSGTANGLPYYVMPFIDGETLKSKLDREKQLGVEEAVRTTREVADALAYAHRHGVIHRDIKPENILLGSGHALVADFGIAKALDEAGGDRLTATGLVIGTARYMSPEQSMGDAPVDGRSDLYSLGCVLFEMLAGEAPFSGSTPQAIIAKRMTLPVPSVRIFRETVPEPVDRVLTRALARAPADRFSTVDEFSEALGGPGGAPAPRAPTGHARAVRLRAIVVVLVVTLAAVLGVLRPWQRAPAPLDPNLLAVVPFDVSDPALTVWREGVVDFLSRTLDGTGTLRSVAPSVVVAGWAGRSDRASAEAVARRVGAGLAVAGNLSGRGLDSVDIRGVLLDVERGSVLGEVTVGGPANRVGELVDSLGLGLLRVLSRDRPVAAVRRGSVRAVPLPALKAFLRGEQFYRRAMYDSALVAYAEAIEQDSMFAFAFYRMKQVLDWSPVTAGAYDESDVYARKGHLRNHGQSERDSLMIAADSALLEGGVARPDLLRLGTARLGQLVRTFPGDPEAWYVLGEALEHAPPGLGQDQPEALSAFDRAVALDSGFAPPWEHLLVLALRYREPDQVRRYALAASTIPGTTDATMSAQLASRLLLDSTALRDEDLRSAVNSAAPVTLFRLGLEFLLDLPDSAETAVAVLRSLAARNIHEGESPPWIVDSLMRNQYLAFALTTHGHLREAVEANGRLIAEPGASPFSGFVDPFLYLALLGAVPAAEADRRYRVSLRPGVPDASWFSIASPNIHALRGLPWWTMRRDSAAIRLFAQQMREAGPRLSDQQARAGATYFEAAAHAYLALIRGDSTAALRHFGAMPACPWQTFRGPCHDRALTNAAVLAARGEFSRAAAVLDTLLVSGAGSVVLVLARLERAEVAEQLQDRETARRNYQFVLDAWRRADPELAPYVDKARAGLARVTGEQPSP